MKDYYLVVIDKQKIVLCRGEDADSIRIHIKRLFPSAVYIRVKALVEVQQVSNAPVYPGDSKMCLLRVGWEDCERCPECLTMRTSPDCPCGADFGDYD